jgi:hypothetical protein
MDDTVTNHQSKNVDPVIEEYKKGIDRTLLRYALKLTPEERLVALQNLLEDAVELRRAGKAATGR